MDALITSSGAVSVSELQSSGSDLSSSMREGQVEPVQQQQQQQQQEQQQQQQQEYKPPQSLFELLWAVVSWYGERPFLGTRTTTSSSSSSSPSSSYSYTTYLDCWTSASHLGAGLLALSLAQRADFIGLCAPNRPEWIHTDWACVQYGLVCVPLVTTLDADTLAFVINEAELRCVVCAAEALPKLLSVAARCPSLRGLVVMTDDARLAQPDAALPVHLYEHVLQLGSQSFPGDYPGMLRQPQDIYTLVYTSGSTGMPKGAVMTDKRWTHFVSRGYMMPNPCHLYSFAPLGHVSERQLYWVVAFYGGQYAFYSGDMNLIFEEMQMVNPTYVSCPPRIYNTVYAQYKQRVEEVLHEKGPEAQRWRVELELLDEFRHVFGNALQFLVTGSAPTAEVVKEFMRKCFAVPVYDGYGTTEAGGIATDGTIGSGVDVRLVDVPELGYFSTDKPYPRGEICVKTDTMIAGYYKNEEKTKEMFVDGYFRTGDIGVRKSPVTVEIIDRIKSVFKLSQGEFICPTKIESVLEKSSFAEQICVCGTPLQDKVVAVVVPAAKACALELQLPESTDLATLVKDHYDATERIILTDFRRLARKHELVGYEVPHRLVLADAHFTAEQDTLTPSMKLRRGPIEKMFKAQIKAADMLPPLSGGGGGAGVGAGAGVDDHGSASSSSPSIRLDSTYDMAGGDSLSAVRIVNRIRKEFGRDVPLSFVLRNPTREELEKFVIDQTLPATVSQRLELPSAALNDLQSSGSFVEKLSPPPNTQLSETISSVLLTGASGFLGAFVLQHLLREGPATLQVVCLVRGGEPHLRKCLAKLSIQFDEANDWGKRIQVVATTDIGAEMLGLESPKLFNRLCRDIDAVIHCAAQVTWMLPYETLRKSNVLPSFELLRFCTTARLKRLFHVSTISCSPIRSTLDNKDAETYEGHSDEYWAANMGPYAMSKWVAEQVTLRGAHLVPVSIFRPANIMADSATGASNTTDYVHRYLHTAITIGAAMDEAIQVNFTPVNIVASRIVKISLASRHTTANMVPVYHLSNNTSPTYSDLARALLDAGYKVDLVRYSDFRKRLLAYPELEQLQLYGLLPMFTVNPFIYNQTWLADEQNTQAALGGESTSKPVSSADLKTWISYLESVKFFPPKASAASENPSMTK